MRKSLSLKREALTELTSADLTAVAGAQALLTHATCGTCGVTDYCTHGASFDQCPTIPINECKIYINGNIPTLDCPR